ncbi:MAG: adenosylcobalamin-dependent ribonucleoside-diphosphate reductase [Acidilobus sp.]|jgi:ribonucleoside-diphosphate reductase alpha chain|nr:adenosylcobalamin-dependent ribonucleoside-diphosphate reductase [Acidilobus sp.]
MSTEAKQLELMSRSLLDPSAEERAKELLLQDIYAHVREAYKERAPNGGALAPLPSCVQQGLCPDDLKFTYNALRVLMSRYLVKDLKGRYMETPSMVMMRVALGFRGRVDPEVLYRALIDGRFMFNSPTLFNMFVDEAKGALSACYVTPVHDDMRGIMDGLTVQVMTFKYGGGEGFSFSELRPRGDVVAGTSGVASGPLSFMRLYDIATDVVKQGGKRRGANMGILHDWHPDLYNPDYDPWKALSSVLPPQVNSLLSKFKETLEQLAKDGYYKVDEATLEVLRRLTQGSQAPEEAGFIQAKRAPMQDSFLTNFNISVGVHDAFMEAVVNDEEWWMVNPRLSDMGDGIYRLHYALSRATGEGRTLRLLKEGKVSTPYLNVLEDLVKKAKERAPSDLDVSRKNPYLWHYPARKLWEEIIRGAWEGGDPGLFFLDNHNKWIPTPWLGAVSATNPCGEEPLYPYESCNLGSLSVDKYIHDGKFDVEAFAKDVDLAVDGLDAVIDYNRQPDPRQDLVNKFTRKVGLGIMGLANALARLGLPYDSEEAVAFTMAVMALLEAEAWKRSWELGAKLGHAPAFECSEFDWNTLTCKRKARPEETVKLLTPALLKASEVMRLDNEWVTVKYHHVKLNDYVRSQLEGETARRIADDGSVRLLRREALERVLAEVFGVSEKTLAEARDMDPVKLASSPRHLLAMAIYDPAGLWERLKDYGRSIGARAPRHTAVNTTAPTGSISIIAGTSSGIEPYFALVYLRRVTLGELWEVVREFRESLLSLARRTGAPDNVLRLVAEIISRHKGSLRWALDDVEKAVREASITVEGGKIVKPSWDVEGFIAGLRELARLYATSMDFDVWYHIAHQAAAQLYTDQAISKTVNLPKWASVNSVATSYIAAWLTGLKGITVYRDESKSVQVIYFGGQKAELADVPIKLVKRPAMRMAIVKKEMKAEEVVSDQKLGELFNVKAEEGNGVVKVETDENSTCKTCNI